jgi:DNA uptake protein ComE-like DNA-binding protein
VQSTFERLAMLKGSRENDNKRDSTDSASSAGRPLKRLFSQTTEPQPVRRKEKSGSPPQVQTKESSSEISIPMAVIEKAVEDKVTKKLKSIEKINESDSKIYSKLQEIAKDNEKRMQDLERKIQEKIKRSPEKPQISINSILSSFTPHTKQKALNSIKMQSEKEKMNGNYELANAFKEIHDRDVKSKGIFKNFKLPKAPTSDKENVFLSDNFRKSILNIQEESSKIIDKSKPIIIDKQELAQDEERIVTILNTGTIKEIKKLNGIGEKRAQKIIEYRLEHGLFSSVR